LHAAGTVRPLLPPVLEAWRLFCPQELCSQTPGTAVPHPVRGSRSAGHDLPTQSQPAHSFFPLL
jgi:hypothetical protein